MMTWCFAMDYLQPNTHCSGSPPSLHTWSMQAHIQSICIHNDPRLTGRGLWHQDAHSAPDITPHWLPWHQALTLSLSPGSESIFGRPWETQISRETSRVRWGGHFVLPRPNTSSRPCDCDSDFISKHVKCSNTFLILGIYIFSKVSVSSPDMSKAKDQGWMFDVVVLSAQSRSLNVYSSLIHSRSPLSHSGPARVQITFKAIQISGICFLIAFIRGRISDKR